MRQIGIVKKVKDNFAEIRAATEEECKTCPLNGTCPESSLIQNGQATIFAKNDVNAEENDLVEFEIDESSILKGTFIIYVIPFLFFILGLVIGIVLEKGFGITVSSLKNALSVMTSFSFLGIGILIVREKDKKFKTTSYITGILAKGSNAIPPTSLIIPEPSKKAS